MHITLEPSLQWQCLLLLLLSALEVLAQGAHCAFSHSENTEPLMIGLFLKLLPALSALRAIHVKLMP